MATLLEIGEDLAAFQALLDEGDGELSAEAEAALDAWFAELGEAREQKLDGYCALVRECELRASARRAEKERLDKRIAADEGLMKRLKDKLHYHFAATNIQKVETARYRIALCTNGGAQPVEVECPELVPAAFTRTVVSPDMEKIRAALTAGQHVTGCRLKERGRHIRIS